MGSSGIKVSFDSANLRPIPIQGGLREQEYSRTVQGLDHEQFMLFDRDGNPVKGFDGDRHSVSVDNDTLRIDGNGYHNHPDPGWGGTLSMTDIGLFARSQMQSLSAIDQQGNTYTIRDKGNGDRAGLAKWVNKNRQLLNKNFQQAYRKQLKQLTTPLKSGPHKGMVKVQVQKRVNGKLVTKTSYQKPMTPEQADRVTRQITTGMYERAYAKAFDKYGFTYVTGKTRNVVG